ncbi:MAG: carboxypeptidase T [Myxococcota bacterium]|jgi:carboxypeptidase T
MFFPLLIGIALAGPPQLMWVTLTDSTAIGALARDYDVWEVDGDRALVYLSVAGVIALKQAGLTLEPAAEAMPLLEEVADFMDPQKMVRSHPGTPQTISGIPGYTCYFTVEELYDTAEQLAAKHPDRTQWTPIGDSWERTQDPDAGYPLMVLTLGTTGAPDLVMVSGIHAREYAPVQTALRFADELLSEDGQSPEATWLLDHRQIHLILMANPDGRKVVEQQTVPVGLL